MTHSTRRFMRERRGFALPLVIIVVFVLAGALAAGFTMTRSERLIDDAGRADIFAQSLAETALQRAMTERASIGLTMGTPPAYDSVRVTLTNGYADVIVSQLRPVVGTEPSLFLLRSHGVSTTSRVAGAPNAQYTVTVLATWTTGTMDVKSAFTSITGIQKNGTSGEIDGSDDCGVEAALPAVAVPDDPSYTQSGGSWSSVLSGGSPLVDSTLGATPAAMAANIGIDWVSIINGSSLTPDFTSDWQGNGFPSSAWFTANPSAWPVIFVNNDTTMAHAFSIPYQGRGMLIVTGNLIIAGSDVWDGVTLVGQSIISNGNTTVSGAVVSGLNVKLGWPVPPNAVGNGNKDFSYHSCNVASAVAGLGRMKVYKATWGNNYSVY